MRVDNMKEIKLAISTAISSQISEIAKAMATQIKEAISIEMSTTTKDNMIMSPVELEEDGDSIFQVTSTSPLLDTGRGKIFHSIFAKLLFISRRTRPDIHVPIGFLGTRVTCSTQEDWIKLKHVLEYLKFTIDLPLTLSMNITSLVTW